MVVPTVTSAVERKPKAGADNPGLSVYQAEENAYHVSIVVKHTICKIKVTIVTVNEYRCPHRYIRGKAGAKK